MHRRTIGWEMSVFVEGTIHKKSKKQSGKEQEEEEEGEGKEAEANQDNNVFFLHTFITPRRKVCKFL